MTPGVRFLEDYLRSRGPAYMGHPDFNFHRVAAHIGRDFPVTTTRIQAQVAAIELGYMCGHAEVPL